MNPKKIDTVYSGKNSKGEVAELHIPMHELWSIEIAEFYSRLRESSEKPIDERKVLQYEVLRDAVASWAVDVPFVRSTVKGKEKDVPFVSGQSPEDAIQNYFKDANATNDRILNSIVNQIIDESTKADDVF